MKGRLRDRPHLAARGKSPAAFLAVFFLGTSIASAERAEIAGTWLQLSAERPFVELTAAGQAAVADYVPLRDDPDLECRPASLTNVIGIPDPPWEIRLHDDRVEIDFEYMDVKRRVPLDPGLDVGDAPFTVEDHPHLGRSVGRYDGDTLVIETADVGRGFVDTRGAVEGYPQSVEMRYEERYRAEGDRLYVEITHTDPANYAEPFDMSFEFLRVDLEVLEFGCTVEAASYDDRLEN